MDPLSQGTVGAALAQSSASKKNIFKISVIGFLAGLAPDLDVLHRNEIPEKILKKNYGFPCVIGETENDLIEIVNSTSFSGFRKNEGVKELRDKLYKGTL